MPAITVVKSTSKSIINATSGQSPTGFNTTTGNHLIVDINNVTFYANVSSFTDTRSNTWQTAIPAFTAARPGVPSFTCEGRELYAENITGGTDHQFTLTLSTTGHASFSVQETAGLKTSGSLDKQTSLVDISGTHGASHTGTATATTTQANELWHGFGFDTSADAHTFSVSAPWSTIGADQIIPNSSGIFGLIAASQVASGTGAAAFVYSENSAVDDQHGIGTSTWLGVDAGGSDAPRLFHGSSFNGVRSFGMGAVL